MRALSTLSLSVVAGVLMWWHRRPKGKVGAPSRPEGFRVSAIVMAITVLLGIAFPLMGLSLIAVLIIEAFVRGIRARAR